MANSPLEVKIAGREMVRGRSGGTFLTTYLPIEHKNGYVFLLADIASSCKVSADLVALLRDHLEALAEGLDATSHLQHRFEQALHVINTDIGDLIEKGDCPPDSLHMITGVVRDTSFVISAVGQPQALFLRKTAKQRFRMFDLAQSLQTELGKIKADKVFSVVLDGDLQPDDVFLLASRDLHKLLSIEDLNPLISTLPPTGALETIEQYMPAKGKLAIMLIQAKRQRELITGYGPGASSQGSLQSLAHTQEETERVLERERPQIIRAMLKLFAAIKSGSSFERREAALNVARFIGRALKAASMYLLLFVNNVAVSLTSLALAAFSKPHKRKQALAQARDVWRGTMTPKQGVAREAALSGKFLVAAAAILLVLFAGSTLFLRTKKQNQQELEAFNTTIERVAELREAAETSIIYQDERYALEQLQEAEQLLNSLTAINAESAGRLQQQQEGIEAARDQVRHVVVPDVTATPLSQSATGGDQDMIVFRDGSVSRIENDTVNDIQPEPAPGGVQQQAVYGDGVILLQDVQRLLYLDTATSTVSDVLINSAEGEFTSVSDMLHYGERLYVLTPSAIYRHQRVSNGEYGPATDWLQDPSDLSNSTSIAIDGTIWIGGNGSLRHFDQGQEVGADTSTIDPPLGTVVDIYTTADEPNLYLLDTLNSRVVVYNKESGRLIAQYKDARFKDGLHVYVNGGVAYVSVVSHVLSFPL